MIKILMDGLHELELIWMLIVQSLGDWLSTPMQLISGLGSEDFYMLVMPILYWSVDATLGLRMGLMLLLSNGVNGVLKLAFHAPRPYWLDPQVKGMVYESSFGMPSGHAQHAASLWGLMAASLRPLWLKIVLVILILLIGLSRIYLGMHFISDVLGGWLFGGIMLWIFLKVERRVAEWLRKRSLREMLLTALATSLLLSLLILASAAALGSWEVPAAWRENALLSQPDEEIDPLSVEGAFTIGGTWLGLTAGAAWLYRRRGGYSAAGTPAQRLLRYLIGVVGIFLFWYLLGSVFPREADALSYLLRYIRYTLVGVWISALAPLLFEKLGLVALPQREPKITPFSSGENPL